MENKCGNSKKSLWNNVKEPITTISGISVAIAACYFLFTGQITRETFMVSLPVAAVLLLMKDPKIIEKIIDKVTSL